MYIVSGVKALRKHMDLVIGGAVVIGRIGVVLQSRSSHIQRSTQLQRTLGNNIITLKDDCNGIYVLLIDLPGAVVKLSGLCPASCLRPYLFL